MTTTDCRSFVARMGTPEAAHDAQLAAHLETCEECRAAARVVGLLERTSAEPEPLALTSFAARIRMRSAERLRHARLLSPLVAAGSIAAAAALAVMVRAGPAEAPGADAGVPTAVAEPLDYADLADAFAFEELEWVDQALSEDELAGLDSVLGSDESEGPI